MRVVEAYLRVRPCYAPPVLRRWWIACSIGEALAVLTVTLVGGLVSWLAPEGSLVHPLLMPITGALEGVVVGGAQAIALRPLGVRARPFVLATTAAFALAWIGGALVSALEPSSPPTLGLVLVAAALAGAVVGALVGIGQAWVVLRDSTSEHAAVWRTTWVFANAAGWAAGMVASAVVSHHVWGALTLGVAAMELGKGALVGAIVGGVTGPMLRTTLMRA